MRNAISSGVCLIVLLAAVEAEATDVFFNPYLSQSDIPPTFYLSGAPDFLEDFEDHALSTIDHGITADFGAPASLSLPPAPSLIDSVDGDAGGIDGSGLDGDSWFLKDTSPPSLTFTFPGPPYPTAAALVWTDGEVGDTTFEAFGPGDVSLISITRAGFADGDNNGGTAEDRFFGVHDAGGIKAIQVTSPLAPFPATSGGIEIDHVQYGVAGVPEPSTLLIGSVFAALAAASGWRRRRRNG